MSSSPHFQYVLVHPSLVPRPGILACQVAHAATEAIVEAPVPRDTHVCALVAGSSEEIERVSALLKDAGLQHAVMREPDEPYNGAATALATAPLPRELVRGHFSTFKVLR